MGAGSVEKVLNDLANLKLDERPILGDRKNIDSALRRDKQTRKEVEVIVVSDSSGEEEAKPLPPAPPRRGSVQKAEQLRVLTVAVADAPTNARLSELVARFVSVLTETNRSRTLTKEGIAFLDGLYTQLTGPEERAPRTRKRTQMQTDKEQVPPSQVKLGILARLRREVGEMGSRRELARMVSEFSAVTKRSSGRTVTKDGFAFLEGLAAKLKVLR